MIFINKSLVFLLEIFALGSCGTGQWQFSWRSGICHLMSDLRQTWLRFLSAGQTVRDRLCKNLFYTECLYSLWMLTELNVRLTGFSLRSVQCVHPPVFPPWSLWPLPVLGVMTHTIPWPGVWPWPGGKAGLVPDCLGQRLWYQEEVWRMIFSLSSHWVVTWLDDGSLGWVWPHQG